MSIRNQNFIQETDRIVSAVSVVVNNIKSNPDDSIATFKANAKLEEGLISKINIRQFQIYSDEPPRLGGNDRGPNPVELVLGALAACQEIVIKAYASVLGICVDSIHVETKGDLDLRGFFNLANIRAGFHHVEYITTITTSEQDKEKLAQLVYFAESRCPVLDILQNHVHVEGSFKFVETKELVS